MDFKDFHDGLLSCSLVLLILSLTFMIVSIILKPFIALEPLERDLILIVASIDVAFCLYYFFEIMNLKKTFKSTITHIFKFGIRLGISALLFLPHLFFLISMFSLHLHNLQLLMLSLIIIIETLLIGLIFKETYDLVFLESDKRNFEIKRNRQLYLNRV